MMQKKARELALDYQNEITSILNEVKQVKKKTFDSGDYSTFDKMIGRLFQGLDLINRIVDGGGAKNQNYDIKVVYQNIFNETDEKYGKIKANILGFNADVKSFIEEAEPSLN